MNDNDKAIAKPPNGRRTLLLSLLIGLFLAAGIGYGIYWALVARYVESTDDAYVGGNLVQITPQVSGTVLAIGADDTDYVKAGQILVELDQADSRVALDQAEAALARSVRQVRNLMATTAQIAANVALRETELARARADLARRERRCMAFARLTQTRECAIEHAFEIVGRCTHRLAGSGDACGSNSAPIACQAARSSGGCGFVRSRLTVSSRGNAGAASR